MVAAQWRGWRPTLRTALVVGLVLRVAVWVVAASGVAQSWDFANDFPFAGAAVLHHQDPVLTNPGRWHILPLMPFMLAAEVKLGQLLHVGWPLIGKLLPVAADLALIPLVGRLAYQRGRLAAFLYACNPVSIMVASVHGQLEPISLALGVGAFLVARTGRAYWAGALGGLSAATGGWPVLLLPGILLALPADKRRVTRGAHATAAAAEPAANGSAERAAEPTGEQSGGWRWETHWPQWLRAAVSAAAVPAVLFVSSPLTVGTPLGQLPHVARLLVGARSVVGDWGWTAVLTMGEEDGDRLMAQAGKLLLVAGMLGVLYLWRRADPLRLTVALLLTFLVLTPRLGVQYLVFATPFMIAIGGRFTLPAVLASALWQALGYLYLPRLSYTGWQHAHRWWAVSSLVVIAFLIAAIPWARRDRHPTGTVAATSLPVSPEAEDSPAVEPLGPSPCGDAVPVTPGGDG